MRHSFNWLLGVGASWLLASGQLLAQQPCPSPLFPQPFDPKGAVQAPQVPLDQQAPFPELAQAGTEAGADSFNPAMFGDLLGMGRYRIPVQCSCGSGSVPASVPDVRRGAFRAADNASPLPSDRVYIFYSYFNDIRPQSAVDPGLQHLNLHRETIGFEKTLFDNRASIGLHMPFIQVGNAYPGIGDNFIGDLSMVAKWAFLYDQESGSGLSTGAVVTFPTGQGPQESIGGRSFNTTYVQPYLGYILNTDIVYFQGFSSLAVGLNTNQNEPTLLLNSTGIGLWLLRNRDSFLRGIAIPLEAHLLTPLDQRSGTFTATDHLALVSGVNFVFTRNSTLGIAAGSPILGPRFYDIEAQAFLNIRF